MDQDTFKSNIRTAKQFILDEQKIVTYVSLSKELCIHVNDAKSILSHIIKDIRENQPKTDISISYMISGLLNDNSGCTVVCPETELEALQATLKVIFYKHVYCVSRAQSVNNVALTAINTFSDFSLCRGLIKANKCIKRTDEELTNLTSFRNQNVPTESNTSNVVKKEKTLEITKNNHVDVKKISEVISEPIKSKTPSPKKDKHTNNGKGSLSTNKSSKPPGKGIAGFFNKSNGDSKPVNTKVKVEKTEVKVKVEKEVEVEPIKEKPGKEKNNSTDITEKVKSNNKSNNTKDSSLKQIKKTAKVDKKRKRLLHVSDSESETETNDPLTDYKTKMAVDQESEDEIPPTPSTNTVKITSGIVNAKKKRKIVDKTYTDNDGYILTKKEEVYESCSDNEEDVNGKQEKENVAQVTEVKRNEIIKSENVKENGKKKKKLSPPQKGKQQTLTNFFKKV